MAPNTTGIDVLSYFYPFGNTPAVDLIRDLPKKDSASILLLGCGDARNVLFTTHANSAGLSAPVLTVTKTLAKYMTVKQHLSFTCVDQEVAILARNALLLSLVLDDERDANTKSIWNIYYHFHLSPEDMAILHAQAKKLADLTATADIWEKGPYNKAIRFQDDSSRRFVREAWQSYCYLDYSKQDKAECSRQLNEKLRLTKEIFKQMFGDNTSITGIRATAPVGAAALNDMTKIFKQFQDQGHLHWDPQDAKISVWPNPTIASRLTATSVLHYGLDPTMGYHLAPAYIQLIGGPLKGLAEVSKKSKILVESAQRELRCWSQSFRAAACNTVINLMVGDVFDASTRLRAVLHDGSSESGCPSQVDATSLFDVIDTSNLGDHCGMLNLLVAATPLLKESDDSVLYTDLLLKRGRDHASKIAEVLCGDFATMSVLLGLFPIGYWTNASVVSLDEDMIDAVMSMCSSGINGQAFCHLAWKRLSSTRPREGNPSLHVPAGPLVKLLLRTYKAMFPQEDLPDLLKHLMSDSVMTPKSLDHPSYHRGSFALLLSYLKSLVETDWPSVIRELLKELDSSGNYAQVYYSQELFTYLHAYGIFTVDTMLQLPEAARRDSPTMGIGNLQQSSPIVCVTLKVPHTAWKMFPELKSQPEKLRTPTVHGLVQGPGDSKSGPWINCFASVQLSFGEVKAESTSHHSKSLCIDVTKGGWEGKSPLLASFLVPLWILHQQPRSAKVGLGFPIHPQTIATWASRLGPELQIYSTAQDNRSNVFIRPDPPLLSSVQPGSVKNKIELFKAPQTPGGTPNPSSITMRLNDSSKMESLTHRYNFKPGPALEALRSGSTVSMHQIGPLSMEVRMHDRSTNFRTQFDFPIPVSEKQSKIRIARKSAYIELELLTKGIASTGEEQDALLGPPLAKCPMAWTVSRVALDLQPSVSLKQNLDWLTPHVSLQMSATERQLRERYMNMTAPCPSDRVNLKDSLLSLFMHFTGKGAQKAQTFGLSMPEAGGIHILILVSALKLNLGEHTGTLDAAIIPLTMSRVPDPAIQRFLGQFSKGGMCQVVVTPGELRLWHRLLPMFTERCRTWEHKEQCELRKSPASGKDWDKTQDPLCSCGRGQFPQDYLAGVPHWNAAKKHATRAAITPLYFVPYVDKIYTGQKSSAKVCAHCAKSDAKLSACSRCSRVQYCSKDCQRFDWKEHKKMCSAKDASGKT